MIAQNTPPARFLFTTWEGGGNVAPPMTLAAQLRRRGHSVRFMCDEASRSEAAAAGVVFRPWTRAPNRPDRTRASDPTRDWDVASSAEGFQRMLATIMAGAADRYAADVLEELRREPADLVVTSEMLLGVMAACESIGQLHAVFAANLCIYPVEGMPIFGPGLPPARTDAERALHAEIAAGSVAMFDGGLPALNAARERLGLGPLDHLCNQIDSNAAYLLGTARAFDFPAALPDRMTYVGPQLGAPAWTDDWNAPWEPTDGRPLVVVGMSSTFQNHAGVLQAVIDAAANLPVRAVVTLADIHPDEVIAARNVWLVRSAPHDALMREATLVVTHGGHGTVMRALKHRLPMLVIPHGRDQDENAVRVASRGAGLTLPPDAGVMQITRALERLLADDSFRRSADQLGQAIADETAATTAVQTLERLVMGTTCAAAA
ncbi:glycosyltransferase [Brevundimonas basaltis]|uniref:MGT family glycosyltransferase n=1 Tax=Brevundimonas basaltis TaxID=472166 RepID=A0A7W8MG89_9CAUL|nr:nucleotide disphospho-sugar-binding domain-containing protein [Brevundimonas basaltis]MBB5290892.1 MGT family glycosyltransferase [Brevundimonas basaltis]